MSQLSVTRLAGVGALERFGSDIDRLNALSERRNPFLSAAFLLCYALRAEYHIPGQEERLYVVREGGRIIGIAPMRRSVERVGPSLGPLRIRGVRLRVLAPLDTERPGILAAPEDEARVAAALIGHFCTRERDWGLLEFAGQVPGTPLYDAMHAATGRAFRARDVQVEPYTEIPITWTDLPGYFHSLVKKMRSNISRQARRLFAHGRVEVVFADDPQSVSAWFDAYCDLDGRSWKHGTDSSIQRHPRRVRFYREIAAGRGGLDPSFIGILLDGVLTAGLLVGSNASTAPGNHGAWCLEMAYDQSRAQLGPGQLLLLLAMGEALRRSDKFLNFMQNFAYYKHRWGAAPIPVANVQLLRRSSLHNLRASIGEWSKMLKARRGKTAAVAGNEVDASVAADAVAAAPVAVESVATQRQEALPHAAEPVPRTASSLNVAHAPDLTRARMLTSAALAYDGPGVRVLGRQQAQAYLPFDIEKG